MSRIIQFPNYEERRLLKRQKFVRRRQTFFNKINAFAKKCFLKIARGFSLLSANVLHHLTVFFFSLLYGFCKPILFVLYGMCVMDYFYLGRKFMTANDISIPVLLLMSVLVLSSEKIAGLIQTNMPFHRLLRCKIYIEPTEQNKTTKHILLEYSD